MVKRFSLLLTFIICLFRIQAQTDRNIFIDDDIQLVQIDDSVYVHVTWETSEEFGRLSSNGLIFIKNRQAIMVDTPMDNQKTKKLAEFLKDSMDIEIKKLIIGHFHDDCLGGLGYIQSQGIESVANKLTIEKCKELKLLVPGTSFDNSLLFEFNRELVECHYFGGGHSFDNIIVWIPNRKILFGGCLIRSAKAQGLGNLSDAVVQDWDKTVRKVMSHCSDAKLVIPGHGEIGDSGLLSHTIELVEEFKSKTK